MAIPAAHHRLKCIHPCPDENGRVSRFMSHAIAHQTGTTNSWSMVNLARASGRPRETRRVQAHDGRGRYAATGELDGRGNLFLKALKEFVLWFLRVCLNRVQFISGPLDSNELKQRLLISVERSSSKTSSCCASGRSAHGEFRKKRRCAHHRRSGTHCTSNAGGLTDLRLLASSTPKGPVSLRFPEGAFEEFFPRLYPEV